MICAHAHLAPRSKGQIPPALGFRTQVRRYAPGANQCRKVHNRLYFKLYALDTTPDLPSPATADQLRAKMHNHVLAYAELMGTYTK